MAADLSATGILKICAALSPPKRGGFFQRTRADIIIKSRFTTILRGEKKIHTGMSFVRKWLKTPPRFVTRRTKVKLHVKTNLPFMKSIDVQTLWILPRAGHRTKRARSTIRVNCI
jgi:hypothetical protein